MQGAPNSAEHEQVHAPRSGHAPSDPLAVSAIGSHTLQETAVNGWSLTDVNCTGDADVQYDNAGATLDIDAGENISCTFTNTKDSPPTDEPTIEPTVEPTDEPTDQPTDEPTIEPTVDSGGATDAATEPGTDTATPGQSSTDPNAIVVLLGALGILAAVLVVTRPRRLRE